MSPALSLNKLFLVFAFTIASSRLQLSHQQRQSGFLPFDDLNQVEIFEKSTAHSYSNLKHENWLHPGQELVFATTTPKPITLRPGQELIFITTTATPSPDTNSVVFVNNKPVVPTMVPFKTTATSASPEFLDCLSKCPTTSEFDPVCATNRQVYGNEQKFNCAKHCGMDIEIVRYGSCEGLFPMARG